jgi:hypothetical protein
MTLAAPIIFIIALLGAVVCAGMAVVHAFGMIRGIRASSEWWVNLIPFIAFASPSAVDAHGRVHRARFLVWLSLAAVFAIVATTIRLILGP